MGGPKKDRKIRFDNERKRIQELRQQIEGEDTPDKYQQAFQNVEYKWAQFEKYEGTKHEGDAFLVATSAVEVLTLELAVTGLTIKKATRRGGTKRSNLHKKRDAFLQEAAEEIWERNPNLSKRAVARILTSNWKSIFED